VVDEKIKIYIYWGDWGRGLFRGCV
jgi:hypothetical protein